MSRWAPFCISRFEVILCWGKLGNGCILDNIWRVWLLSHLNDWIVLSKHIFGFFMKRGCILGGRNSQPRVNLLRKEIRRRTFLFFISMKSVKGTFFTFWAARAVSFCLFWGVCWLHPPPPPAGQGHAFFFCQSEPPAHVLIINLNACPLGWGGGLLYIFQKLIEVFTNFWSWNCATSVCMF